MRMYGHLLKPEWRAIDIIDHTEGTVHAVVRVKNPDAKPPKLKTQRLSPNEVLLVYTRPPGEDHRQPDHVHAQRSDSL